MPINNDDFLRLGEEEARTLRVTSARARRDYGGENNGPQGKSRWQQFWNEQFAESSGPFGGRDNAAVLLIWYCRAKRLPLQMAARVLLGWNEDYCNPPLSEEAILEKVERFYASEWEPTMPVFTDAADGVPEGMFHPLTTNDLLSIAETHKGVPYVVDKILMEAGVHFISAPPGGCKSWVMLDLARALVSGSPWLGLSTPIPQCPVVYVDEEMGEITTGARVKMLGFQKDTPFYYFGKQGFNLRNESHVATLVAMIEEWEAKVMFLDTLVGVCPGLLENDAPEVSKLRRIFSRITATGCSLFIAHHDRKGGQQESSVAHERMAGSREFAAIPDFIYAIERKGDYYHLFASKNRHTSDDEALSVDFTLSDVTEGDENGDPVDRVELRPIDVSERSARILASVEEKILTAIGQHGKMDVSTICDNVRYSRNATLGALNDMVDKGLLRAESVGRKRFFNLPEMGQEGEEQ